MDYSLTTAHKFNRIDWEFEYSAKTLADAAKTKRDYRQSRVDWWKNALETVMAEIKESGIEVNEGMAGNNFAVTSIQVPKITIRLELQNKVKECHEKIHKHMSAVYEYDGWVQVLTANANAKLKLKHGDWLFFFGSDA